MHPDLARFWEIQHLHLTQILALKMKRLRPGDVRTYRNHYEAPLGSRDVPNGARSIRCRVARLVLIVNRHGYLVWRASDSRKSEHTAENGFSRSTKAC